MDGDISRNSFDSTKHYSGVRWQQGRPTTDADHNEAAEIAAHRTETQTVDSIGTGAPREQAGFALSFDANSALQIGAGRFYVDGLLCEQETAVAYSAQPHLPAPPELRTRLGNAQFGLIYLEAFERAITAQDDPNLRDVALGGVDTTTRLQTVWQVKLLPLGIALPPSALQGLIGLATQVRDLTAQLASAPTDTVRIALMAQRRTIQRQLRANAEQLGVSCSSPFAEWNALIAPPDGTLTISTVPGVSPTDPCDVPAGGGFTRGENQMYRVQVQSVPANGTRNGATFVWSRDNGAVLTSITAVGSATTGSVSGSVVDVSSVQRDDYLGIHTNDWVEYTDDTRELNGQPGILARVTGTDTSLNRLTLDRSITVDFGRHPRLRKWDQGGSSATASGVAMNTNATPVLLENGIQVLFGAGTYRVGDYWQFAARAITGTLDAPATAQPREGVQHHFARLGVVARQGETLQLIGDCRAIFPPLTAITAEDISFDNSRCNLPDTRTVQDAIEQLCARNSSGGICTITVAPGPDWFRAFAQIPENGDAEICFPLGTYELAEPVEIPGKGHVRLHGIGEGSQIVIRGNECALLFRRCASVTICDMQITARGDDAEGLMGAITCEDTPSVSLDRVTLRNSPSAGRATACLRVINNIELVSAALVRGSVDVQNCQFLVGHSQIGALVINCARAYFANNTIRCIDGRTNKLRLRPDALADVPLLLEHVRRVLVSSVRVGRSTTSSHRNLLLNDLIVHFRTDQRLDSFKFFEQMVELFPPRTVRDLGSAKAYLSETLSSLLTKPETVRGFDEYVQALAKEDETALYAGILIGGQEATDVRIVNNTIMQALQGIHIGQKRPGKLAPGTPAASRLARSGTVVIQGNTVQNRITPTVNREAYGVVVGNCESLLVEGNRFTRDALESTGHMVIDGIRAVGVFGRRLVVRHNDTSGYRAGVFIQPRNPATRSSQPLWLVADNVASVIATDQRVRVEGNV